MKKNVFVELNDEKSFIKCQEQLHNQWEFSNASIAEILEKHKNAGVVIKFSSEHYLILRELINDHLSQIDNPLAREAYLASRKTNLLAFHDPVRISSVIAMFSTLMTFFCEIKDWDIAMGIAAIVTFGAWGYFIYAQSAMSNSPVGRFYTELFTNIGKNGIQDS